MMRNKIALATSSLVLLAAALACTRCAIHHAAHARATHDRAPARPIAQLGAPRIASHRYRLLLGDEALRRLAESARRETEPWRRVVARADEAAKGFIESGYQGFEWADALADLTLVWHGTGDDRYARAALIYLRALLDDRNKVGDGKGGQDVVTHDSGYGMRTFGAYAALGYDWLRDAPGITAELRRHILERLEQWIAWYGNHGYLRDKPIANYYWGYLTTLSFAGIAAAGDTPRADDWLARARAALEHAVLPTFQTDLDGGGWPEGWQYGEYTSVEVALVARAFETGAGLDVTGHLPWLSQMVTYHVHALLPDEQSVYDGGTWGEHPARPSAAGIAAAAIALDGVDETHAAEARWMIAHALPPLSREQAWLGLLADRPGAAERSPREDGKTSLHLARQGLTFARSDWSKDAVWTSFQAGPRLAEDHQDADQGHFELFRGSDGLIVDGGDSEGSATINHNTLLIDDGGRNLNYPPNQGVWGTKVRTTRFADDGVAIVATGEIGEAYAPSCAEDGCTRRSVRRITRTFAFVRPHLLVVDDRVVLDRSDTDVTWAAHMTVLPRSSAGATNAVVGHSRVDIRTLEPEMAEAVVKREPTPSGEGSHRANHPWGPMWRVEVASPRGAAERWFSHWITADRAEAAAPVIRRLSGDRICGGLGTIDGRATAVLFVDSKGGSVSLGEPADTVVLMGLDPGSHYKVSINLAHGCSLVVSPASEDGASTANAGGFLRVSARDCGGT